MKGIKSVSYLEKGDLLKAFSPITVDYVSTDGSFAAGQTMGVVTDENRLGNDGTTYVDFTTAAGRKFSIDKTLLNGLNKAVTFSANPDFFYPDQPTVGTTQQSSGGILSKVSDILGQLGNIWGKVKTGTTTPPVSNDGTTIDIGTSTKTDTNTQTPAPASNSNTIWYVVGGLVVFVGGVIGFIVYSRNRKKKQLAD